MIADKIEPDLKFNAMNFYWSLRNVPELAPLAKPERERVHDACLRRYVLKAPVTRRSLIAYAVSVCSPVALVAVMLLFENAVGGSAPLWLIVTVMSIGGNFGHFMFSRVAVPHLRQFYPEYIRSELKPKEA